LASVFEHDRRDGGEDRGLGDAPGFGAGDIADDLAAARRMADMNCVAQVESGRQLDEIGGVCVHLVAGPGLARSAMAPAVMRDHPVALLQEEQHLIVPVVGN
jgi:hypothetical protein